MIPGFDPLTLGSLLLLAGAQPSCELPQRTKLSVTPKALEVRFDYSQSLRQMQREKSDTINPHNFGSFSYTQGLMKGDLKMVPRVKLNYKTYSDIGKACVWYDEVSVVLELDPTIVIAREVYEDNCMREAVLEHEMKHVKIDRDLVNKYTKTIGAAIYAALEERGFKSDIIGAQYVNRTVERMQQTVYEAANHEFSKMNLERLERQRALDNKKEYERVNAECPDFGKKLSDDVGPISKKRFWFFNQ